MESFSQIISPADFFSPKLFYEENNGTSNNFGSVFSESNIKQRDFKEVLAEIVIFVGEVDDLVKAVEEVEGGGS